MIAAAALLCLAQATASPAAAPSPRPSPTGPVVVLETSLGRIRIGLYDEQSPISANNFVKYARKGHFNGTVFHRVMPNFMIQGGGMTPDLTEKPTDPPIRNEARTNNLRNSRGTVAMARTNDPNSATAQFFINLKDNAFLDYGIRGAGYAVFGQVLEGMEVVDKIATVATTSKGGHDDVPVTPVVITARSSLGRAHRHHGPAPNRARSRVRAQARARRADRSPRPHEAYRSYSSLKALTTSAAFLGSTLSTAASPDRRA
jgi:peptidyl-prolyl cis-trans isomerase A (cyclophilin A)